MVRWSIRPAKANDAEGGSQQHNTCVPPRRQQQYPSNALERQQLSCGAFNEQDIEEAFTFLEEHGLPMFDAREVCVSVSCVCYIIYPIADDGVCRPCLSTTIRHL